MLVFVVIPHFNKSRKERICPNINDMNISLSMQYKISIVVKENIVTVFSVRDHSHDACSSSGKYLKCFSFSEIRK